MATRGVQDADVSSNDILHAYKFYAISFMKALDGRAGAGDTGALRRVSETAFFGVVGTAPHGM